MKKFMKFIGFVIVGIIAISVIGAMFSDDTETNTASNETKSSDTEKAKVYAIGDKVEVGKLAYIVSNVETTSEIKSDNEFIESAKTDGQFVIIDIEAFNNDKEARMVDSAMFKMKDNQNREFDPSNDSEVMMVVEDMSDFFLQDINPGISKKGKLVFELPSDAKGYSLEVSSGFGWSGGEYEQIKLK